MDPFIMPIVGRWNTHETFLPYGTIKARWGRNWLVPTQKPRTGQEMQRLRICGISPDKVDCGDGPVWEAPREKFW